jgi:HTH-type transcriptional regulator / antitoxin HigA
MTEEQPASPGEFIKAELQRRAWTQADFASVVGRHIPIINEILQGKRPITPELAVAIGTALGTGPKIWLDRESAYRLSLIKPDDSEVQRRARLFELAPVKEMQKRGWIKPTKTVDDIERELRTFFENDSLDAEPVVQAAARQSLPADEFTAAQRAWLWQAHRLASIVNVRPFHPDTFKAGLAAVRALADTPEKARHVPKVLAELGVRFVVVEPLPRSRIDGAAFCLDENPSAPVIVLSLRYDRIDWFWHTLAHELTHVKHGDKPSVDVNLVGETRVDSLGAIEERADKEGASLLIPPDLLQSFIIRMRPFYYKERIREFAHRMQVHPGIVNGQLQHHKEIGWDHNREMLVKVRDIVISTAMTDGWGKPAQHFLNEPANQSNQS